MKGVLVVVVGLFLCILSLTFAQAYRWGAGSNFRSSYVRGYTRSDGSYTRGYYRTSPNRTQYDNYGTRGNYNPWTGRHGTKTPRY